MKIDVLKKYGFTRINREQEERDENYVISKFDYQFNIGRARRGQFYYILVNEDNRSVSIYASEPDGSGTCISCPDILISLISDGIIVQN